MSRRSHRALALLAVLVVAPALTATALAAKATKGATYKGTTVHDQVPISLKVSSSGRSVTATSPSPPLYCQGGGGGVKQIAKPASISKSGAFKTVIVYEFVPEHKITAKLFLSGNFYGRTAQGIARSEFLLAKQCNGTTEFTAEIGAAAARASAASALHVSSTRWEVAEDENLHSIASGGKFEYCAAQPVTGLTPVVAYSHAPVGKSFETKLAAPAASGSIPAGAKTKFKKASGKLALTFAAPSFAGHKIAPGAYTFSLLVAGKTVALLKITLDGSESHC